VITTFQEGQEPHLDEVEEALGWDRLQDRFRLLYRKRRREAGEVDGRTLKLEGNIG
jgi:hypothetical protein